VPFGQIKWLVNLSRDWAIVDLELGVPLETDLGLVEETIGAVGAALTEDGVLGRHLLEPPRLRGIIRTDGFNAVLSVMCKTRPDEGRFDVRREVLARIRVAFDTQGIPFARVHPLAHGRDEEHAAGHDGLSLQDLSQMIHETVGSPEASQAGSLV
jgi:small-conductance mechanosensitive channel